MAIHRFDATQFLPVGIDEAWAFFSDPGNLPAITPPSLDFQICSPLPAAMYAGMMIEYRVRPMAGVRVRWLTEITQVRAPHYFVDEQRCGPYALWHHEHEFREVPGGVQAVDRVHYRLPLDPWSALAHLWLVRPKLEKIFNYRAKKLAEIFGVPRP